jgi:dephospho-CoA kinase
MLRIGLTGGIGSGKSTVAQRFSALGAAVIDADSLAREVVQPGSEGLSRITARFGDDVLDDDGALNRAALGAVVFADQRARHDLEAITHPLIAERTAALVAAAPHDAIVVHDVPLLVEKHLGPAYHLVVVVGADSETRVRRLMQSRGMTEDDIRSRIVAQADDGARRAAADVWLDNDGPREDLEAAVDSLWHGRLVPFEQDVRHRLRSRPPEQVEICESDPDWAGQAQRLVDRLRLAFAEVLAGADHVGGTAVPGMPAQDVIDLQVGVIGLDAADDVAVRARLDAAGFPRDEGGPADLVRGQGGGRPERVHGSADPGRVATIHVREVGSPGWRWALLARDWLRADAGAAAEYAGQQARIVATDPSATEYAAATEQWLESVSGRAEAWATRTGWAPGHG